MINLNIRLLILLAFTTKICFAQDLQTENIFIITLDGLRWEELFGGADDSLTVSLDFVKDTASLKTAFWADT